MLEVQDRYVWGYRGDVFSWELVGGVRYEQASFTHSTISHNNTLGEERLKNGVIVLHTFIFSVSILMMNCRPSLPRTGDILS